MDLHVKLNFVNSYMTAGLIFWQEGFKEDWQRCRLSQDSARRPQEVQHLIHCCLAWYEFMPSVPNNGRTPFFSFDLDRKYSCPSIVLPYTEEVISRTFLGENRFRLVSHDHFLYKSSTPDSFLLKLPRWLRDFPSWRPQLFVSCNKSIQTKRANPSTNTPISADKKINLAQIFSGNSFSCAGNYMCIICIENKDNLCTTCSAANPFPVQQNKCAQSCNELMQRRLFETGCELPHRK